MTKQIVIDAYQDTSDITGTDRMAVNFLIKLQEIDKTNNYKVICSNEDYVANHITNTNFKVLRPWLKIKHRLLKRLFDFGWKRLIILSLLINKSDTYFSFHNMRLPRLRVAEKMIASNLDVIPIALEEYKNLGRESYVQTKSRYSRVGNMADKIVSISNFSKQELVNATNVSASKIDVIYLAADASFLKANKKTVSKNYILTIGGSESRKNVQTVIDAYDSISEDLKNKYDLKIIGGEWRDKKLHLTKGAEFLGFVPEDQLPSLFYSSTAFVFASKYEGFGLSILEAMASKVPVINARGSSLDEVAGQATLNFDPDNKQELVKHLKNLLNNEAKRTELIEKGSIQLEKFSWEKSATKLHALLCS